MEIKGLGQNESMLTYFHKSATVLPLVTGLMSNTGEKDPVNHCPFVVFRGRSFFVQPSDSPGSVFPEFGDSVEAVKEGEGSIGTFRKQNSWS